MINKLIAKVFGTANERQIKRLYPRVERINALEPEMLKLSDAELLAKSDEFRSRINERLSQLEAENGDVANGTIGTNGDADRSKEIEGARDRAIAEVLDEILEEAFAVVREAGRRVLNMRHFDVQLIGGMVLHQGKIAEMKTGEGKTLVATLPVYLNALAGRGVHVVTVNDYLAKRDSEWMGKLYTFLGLTVGVIVHDLDDEQRREAYAADVTYGTNNEFGFDYLRDNMKFDLSDCVQRGAQLRHRRRSRLHPDRRSPHPAHHQRRQRGVHRQVLQGQSHHSPARDGRGDAGPGAGNQDLHWRLRHRREAPHRHWLPKTAGKRPSACWVSATSPIRRTGTLKHHVETALKAHAPLPPRCRVRGERWRGASSSMSSPGASCRDAAGLMACTRRSRPRKTSRSSARTRRWPPSPSRIISACTRSWPA